MARCVDRARVMLCVGMVAGHLLFAVSGAPAAGRDPGGPGTRGDISLLATRSTLQRKPVASAAAGGMEAIPAEEEASDTQQPDAPQWDHDVARTASRHPELSALLQPEAAALLLSSAGVTPGANETLGEIVRLIEADIEAKLVKGFKDHQAKLDIAAGGLRNASSVARSAREQANLTDAELVACARDANTCDKDSKQCRTAFAQTKAATQKHCNASTDSSIFNSNTNPETQPKMPAFDPPALECDFAGQSDATLCKGANGDKKKFGLWQEELRRYLESWSETWSKAVHKEIDGVFENHTGHAQECKLATDEQEDARVECERSETRCDAQGVTCKEKEKQQAVSMCVFGDRLQEWCRQKSEFDALSKEVLEAEADRQKEWETIQLLKCMIKRHWRDGNVSKESMKDCHTISSNYVQDVGSVSLNEDEAGEFEADVGFTCKETDVRFSGFKVANLMTTPPTYGITEDGAYWPEISLTYGSAAFPICRAGSIACPSDLKCPSGFNFLDGSCHVNSCESECCVPAEVITPPKELSNCGAVGRFGPTQAACDESYGAGKVNVVDGYQLVNITEAGLYRFELSGARGGHHGGGKGGFGARTSRTVSLEIGDQLVVAVGQMGRDHAHNGGWGGAGGGGTFVAKVVASGGDLVSALGLRVQLLAAAGGGAGLQKHKNDGQAEGGRDEEGDPNTRSLGRLNGGGAGFYLDGSKMSHHKQIAAKSFLNGAIGGDWKGASKNGGFGGGGNPYNGGGGGGGFDGGDCANHDCYGGSSYGGQVEPNANDGHGKLFIAIVAENA